MYFRTSKFKEYGKLSHKNLDDLQSGVRALLVTGEEGKEDPAGFCAVEAEEGGGALHGSRPGAKAVPAGILSAL